MYQSTTPSLSQTIWQRWASRQFLSLPTVQTLLPVTFAYSLRSEAVVMRQFEEMKEAMTKVIDTLTQKDFNGAFQKSSEWYKCIVAEGDYFEVDYAFMCVLAIKNAHTKKSANLFNDPRIYIYIYIHTHTRVCQCTFVPIYAHEYNYIITDSSTWAYIYIYIYIYIYVSWSDVLERQGRNKYG